REGAQHAAVLRRERAGGGAVLAGERLLEALQRVAPGEEKPAAVLVLDRRENFAVLDTVRVFVRRLPGDAEEDLVGLHRRAPHRLRRRAERAVDRAARAVVRLAHRCLPLLRRLAERLERRLDR